MSMSSGSDYVQYRAQRAAREAEWTERHEIKAAIDFCASALSDRTSRTVEDVRKVLNEVLLPKLADRSELDHYHREVGGNDKWHYFALEDALEGPFTDRRHVISTFESCVVIAEYEDIIQSEVGIGRPAHEYGGQIGVRFYSADSTPPDELQLLDEDDELKATILTGGQGSGKSTAMKTLAENRIARDHTIIDLIDFHKAESATYDLPQRQEILRRARKELGLNPGFGDGYDPPTLEVVAPLSDELAGGKVPYNSETEQSTLRAFTIPASSLTYRQLVMLLPHTTPTQENYLQSAYQELERQGVDYSLADLATAVREDTNAGDGVADRLEQALKRTQQKPYIRDTKCDLTLDWDSLMQGEPQVTAFTVHMVREEADKLALCSYLLDQLYEARKRLLRERRLHQFPPLTAIFRELHTIVPRGKSEQDNEKTLEGYMIDTFSELIALMRHVNMEILADTQKFKQQLHPEVAKLFHRIYAFGGQKPDIKKVFATRVDDTSPASKVAGYEKGECALVSGDGYQLPIQFAPPRSHHVDAKAGEDGLTARVEDDSVPDEWAPAPWDASIPDRLRFESVPDGPVARFLDEHLTSTGDMDDFLPKTAVTEAYNAWAQANGEEVREHKQVHRRISKVGELEDGQTRRADADGRVAVYWGQEIRNDPRRLTDDTSPSETAAGD